MFRNATKTLRPLIAATAILALTATPSAGSSVVATIPIPGSSNSVDVNPTTNRIYTSGGASYGQTITVIDGATHTVLSQNSLTGSYAHVNPATNRFYAGQLSPSKILVYDGATNGLLTSITVSGCAIEAVVDPSNNRVYGAGQCGGGNDPVYIIDGATSALLQTVGSGGVMGGIVVNPATHNIYLNASGVLKKVNPTTYAVTSTSLAVQAANPVTNRLYAAGSGVTQVVDGTTENVITTLPASGLVAVDTTRNHVYVTDGATTAIKVFDGTTNASLGSISLPGGTAFDAMAVNSTTSLIYLISGTNLLAVKPLNGVWTTKTSMPAARSSVAGGVINGILYVAGGHDGTRDSATLQSYNPGANSWSTLASMPAGRYGGNGTGVIDGKLYVGGGWTTSPGLPHGNLYVYDPSTNAWTEKAPLPSSRLSACGATGVINNKIYMTTACNGYSGYYNYLDAYDPATNSWSSLAPSAIAHATPAWGVIGNKLYVAGGVNNSGNVTATLEVYDPATNTWTTKSPMPVAGQGFASGVINGKLYVTAGTNGSTTYYTATYIYDPASDTWTTDSSTIPTACSSPAFGVINDALYVAGGGNATGALSPLQVYATSNSTYPLTIATSGTGTGTVTSSLAGANVTTRPGTLVSGPTWTTGKQGNGLSLSSGQYVSVPHDDSFNITGDLTISLWVKPNSVACTGADPAYTLVSKRSSNIQEPYEFMIGCGGALRYGAWSTLMQGPQWPGATSTGTITAGAWQHVAMTRSYSGNTATVTFYINGVPAGSSSQASGPTLTNSDPLWISRGAYYATYTNEGTYSGLMDEVLIYNRALSASELYQLYNNSYPSGAKPVGNWKLDETGGTIASDSKLYNPGDVVTLTAAPSGGSTFAGWSGACSGASSACTVTMDAAKSVTAAFTSGSNPTITVQPATNGTVSPSGTVSVASGGSQKFDFTPNSGYHIANVLVDGTSVGIVASYTFNNVTANHTIAVTFAADPTITVRPATNGTTSPSGTVTVTTGGSQKIDFTPNSGYHIADVLVDGVSVGIVASYTFSNVTVNHTIEAIFAADTATLTIAKTGQGKGKVTSAPAGINCGADCNEAFASGTSVTLTAAADPGYTFNGWSGGGCSGTLTTCSLTVNSDRTVTATFIAAAATVVDFDSVNATAGSVEATAYLSGFGITLSNVTAGTSIVVFKPIPGESVAPSSTPNLLTQVGSNDPVSFTLNFASPVESVSFARAKLYAGATGITHPEWSAHAFNEAGTEIGSVNETLISSYSDVPAKTFTLVGPGIKKVRFDSNNMHFAAFSAVQIDDLTFVAAAQTAFALESERLLGGSGDQMATGLTAANSSLYLSGMNNAVDAEALAAAYASPPGTTPVWSANWPNPSGASAGSELFRGVAATSEGVYFAGYSYSQTTDSVGGKEIKSILVKFPLNGATGPAKGGAAWVAKPNFQPYGGGESFATITSALEGAITFLYAGGYAQANGANNTATLAKYDTAGNLQWSRAVGNTGYYNNSGIEAIAPLNGYLYLAGNTHYPYTDANAQRGVVWKYDTAGNPAAGFPYTDTTGITVFHAAVAAGSAIYAAGQQKNGPNGGFDAAVVKLDEAGNVVWRTVWGGSADDVPNGIAMNGTTLYVVGETASFGSGGKDAFILSIDPLDGRVISTAYYGGANDDAARAVVYTEGRLHVLADTKSSTANGNEAGKSEIVLLTYTTGAQDTTPPVISGISVTGIGDTGATLNWTTNEPGTSKVEYRAAGSAVWLLTALDANLATAHSVTLSGLSPGTNYYYRVQSRDGSGNLATSADLSFATTGTPADTTAPTAPTSLQATPTTDAWTNDNTIQVSWTAATDAGSGIAGYSLLWDHSATTEPDNTVETAQTAVTSQALADGTDHWFHIRAVDKAGNAGPSAHLGPFKVDTTPPGGSFTINSGAATTTSATVTLQLTATDAGSGMGQMQFSNDGTTWSTAVAFAASTAWSLSAGSGQKTVYAKFSDALGNWMAGPLSATILVQAAGGPQNPTGLQLTGEAGSQTLSLLWDKNPEEGTLYNIFRSRTENGIFYKVNTFPIGEESFIWDPVKRALKVQFTDTSLKEGTIYFYRIQSSLAGVNSTGFSNTVSGKTATIDDYLLQAVDPANFANVDPTRIVEQGNSTRYYIQIQRRENFKGTLNLSCTGVPTGLTYRFYVNEADKGQTLTGITPPAIIVLEVTAGSAAAVKEHRFQLLVQNVSNAGSSERSTTLNLTVVPAYGEGIHVEVGKDELRKGESVRLYGEIWPPLSGRHVSVTLTQKESGAVTTRDLTTGTGGKFEESTWIPSLPIGFYTVSASWTDDDSNKHPSEVRSFVVNKGLLTLTCLREANVTPALDTDFKILGALSPAVPSATIKLLILDPLNGTTERTIYADGTGKYQKLDKFFTTNGIYQFKAYFAGDNEYIGAESDWLVVPVGIDYGRAIIVGGGEALQANTYWEVTKKLIESTYRDFKARGFTDDMIWLLLNAQGINIDNNPGTLEPVVDEQTPTVSKLSDAIKTRFTASLNANTPLFIYMQGHGTADGRFKVLGSDQFITAADLKSALDNLQGQVNANVILILEACYSGNFISTLSGPRRIIVTSAGNEPYNTDASGRIAFSRYLFTKLREGDNLYKAFNYARNMLINMGYPSPKLDDNGDGKADSLDGLVAANTYLNGALSWGVKPLLGNIGLAAVLKGETSAPISVSVTKGDAEIDRVWVQIIAPNANLGGEETITYPELTLTCTANCTAADRTYSGTLTNLTSTGSYKIVAMAEDASKESSDPVTAFISVLRAIVPGDVNDDTVVNLADAILSLQVMEGNIPSGVTVNAAADVNGDGKIGLAEVVYILQKVAGVR